MITPQQKAANRADWLTIIKLLESATDIQIRVCAGCGFCNVYDKNRAKYVVKIGDYSVADVHSLIHKVRAINAKA